MVVYLVLWLFIWFSGCLAVLVDLAGVSGCLAGLAFLYFIFSWFSGCLASLVGLVCSAGSAALAGSVGLAPLIPLDSNPAPLSRYTRRPKFREGCVCCGLRRVVLSGL